MKKYLVVILSVSLFGIVLFGSSKDAQSQPLASYCCDGYGVRQCVINPSYPGSQCFCYGKGYGFACY